MSIEFYGTQGVKGAPGAKTKQQTRNVGLLEDVSFTNIPSWVKRITISYADLSVGGTAANILVQLGTKFGFVTTNYLGTVSSLIAANSNAGWNTTGFQFITNPIANIFHGNMVLMCVSKEQNIWVVTNNYSLSNEVRVGQMGAAVVLPDILTGIRFLNSNATAGGTVFDSGIISLIYE